jgi:hypothetical protein
LQIKAHIFTHALQPTRGGDARDGQSALGAMLCV